MRRLYTVEQFAQLDEKLQRDANVSIATCSFEEPEFLEGSRVVRYTFSTPAVGRDNHTVAADGWLLKNYLRNPVFLWAHDDKSPPIGRVIEIGSVGGKLKGSVEYAERELNPFADMIYRLVRAKYINAVSASWLPVEWEFSHDRSRPKGIDFEEVDLLEVSQVPIPALPDALAEARSSGIDTGPLREWAERLLDTGGLISVPRTELETLRRAAAMPKITRTEPKVEDTLKTKHARALARAPKVPAFKRGLYDVAQLCYMLENLGYCHNSSEYEAALEGDNSPIPGMLGEALIKFGEAVKAMAEEEVDELLEAHGGSGDDEGEEVEGLTRSLSPKDKAYISAAKTPRARAWRTGIAVARAGSDLSPTSQDQLETASEHQERAMKHHKAMGEHHGAVSDGLKSAKGKHERATSTLDELGIHIRAARANPAESADHLESASKAHGEATKQAGAVADVHKDIGDRHEDVGDSHRGMGRCMKASQRCMRSALSGGAATSEPESEESNELEDSEKAKEEEANKARAARAAKAQLLKKEPTAA